MQKLFASLVKTTDKIVVKWAANRIDRIGIVVAVRITIPSIKTNVFDLYNMYSVLLWETDILIYFIINTMTLYYAKQWQSFWRPSWPTSRKSEQLPLEVRWPDQPPTLQPQVARVINAQSCTAMFRSFSSHQKSSAYLYQRYSPATFRPNLANLNASHSDFKGNKQFFPCSSSQNKWKLLGNCIKNSHKLFLF